jgi:hypothetical protein
MADIPVPGCQAFCIDKRKALETEYKRLLNQSPDADALLKQLFKVLCDIEDVAGYTPASVGDSDQWSSIVNTAQENTQNFSKALGGKTLYSALYGTNTVALQELKALLKQAPQQTLLRRRRPLPPKRMVSLKFGGGSGKAVTNPPKRLKKAAPTADTPAKVTTRNFFAQLRTTNMDTDSSGSETIPQEEAVSPKTCRPPPHNLNISNKPDSIAKPTEKGCERRH